MRAYILLLLILLASCGGDGATPDNCLRDDPLAIRADCYACHTVRYVDAQFQGGGE